MIISKDHHHHHPISTTATTKTTTASNDCDPSVTLSSLSSSLSQQQQQEQCNDVDHNTTIMKHGVVGHGSEMTDHIRHRGRYHPTTVTSTPTTTALSPHQHQQQQQQQQQTQQLEQQEPLIVVSRSPPVQSIDRRRRRRLFMIPRFVSILSYFGIGSNSSSTNTGLRFEISAQSILDAIVDAAHTVLEYFVYFIGPLLIFLALAIISLLAYTFFTIILPMIYRKHIHSSFQYIIIVLHVIWVLFLLVNVLYNYLYCVLTKHSGVTYDTLVREFATVCHIQYPETPEQLQSYRKNYHSLMSLRMKCRQERYQQQQDRQQQQQEQQQSNAHDGVLLTEGRSSSMTTTPNGVNLATATTSLNSNSNTSSTPHSITHTSATTTTPTATATFMTKQQQSPPSNKQQPPIRLWTLMLPYEWGYCSSSHQPKPPRSHYDHVTKQLVLNLDHYCPWMFNVGTL
jgi:DHHC palmitoyltransferase